MSLESVLLLKTLQLCNGLGTLNACLVFDVTHEVSECGCSGSRSTSLATQGVGNTPPDAGDDVKQSSRPCLALHAFEDEPIPLAVRPGGCGSERIAQTRNVAVCGHCLLAVTNRPVLGTEGVGVIGVQEPVAVGETAGVKAGTILATPELARSDAYRVA